MRAEHAAVAVDLDGKPESARLKPEWHIPREQRRQQGCNEQQVRISGGTVLRLVTQYQLAERAFHPENPLGQYYLHRMQADHGRSVVGGKLDTHAINLGCCPGSSLPSNFPDTEREPP